MRVRRLLLYILYLFDIENKYFFSVYDDEETCDMLKGRLSADTEDR